jgi:DNA-binding transcriptional ArsR family regulator
MKEFCNEAYCIFFSTLANRTRLAIIDMLNNGRKGLSEISAALQQEENIISYNLESLDKCAIVFSEGSGKEKYYSLNRAIIEPLSENLSFHMEKHCHGFMQCIPAEKLKEYMKAEAAKTTYIEHE